MTDAEMVRKTFTLTKNEEAMLENIVKRRHPSGFRMESLVIRDLIREEYERSRKEQRQ